MNKDPVLVLKDLIRINTSNPPGNEGAALKYIRDLLTEDGIDSIIQESAPGRGNLLATLKADVESNQPPLVLLSHIDVVPADETEWDYPPFHATEVDGYIYGRGSVDTKQLTVMHLNAFIALKNAKTSLIRDVYLLVTGDEECGSKFGLQYFLENEIEINDQKCIGSKLLANSDVLSEGGGFPILVGDKTFYLCECGQKGCGTVEFSIDSTSNKRPFLPDGEALGQAMSLVSDIGTIRLDGIVLKSAKKFIDRLADACNHKDRWQNSLSPLMMSIVETMAKNSLTVTMITAERQGAVTVTCDLRLLPGYGAKDLKPILEQTARKWGAKYVIKSLSQGYESVCYGRMEAILENATLEHLDSPAQTELLPFLSMGSSDGRFLAPIGAHVYGYSPVLSWDMTFDEAVKLVHGVNERIHVDSLRFGCNVLTSVVLQLAGKGGDRKE